MGGGCVGTGVGAGKYILESWGLLRNVPPLLRTVPPGCWLLLRKVLWLFRVLVSPSGCCWTDRIDRKVDRKLSSWSYCQLRVCQRLNFNMSVYCALYLQSLILFITNSSSTSDCIRFPAIKCVVTSSRVHYEIRKALNFTFFLTPRLFETEAEFWVIIFSFVYFNTVLFSKFNKAWIQVFAYTNRDRWCPVWDSRQLHHFSKSISHHESFLEGFL